MAAENAIGAGQSRFAFDGIEYLLAPRPWLDRPDTIDEDTAQEMVEHHTDRRQARTRDECDTILLQLGRQILQWQITQNSIRGVSAYSGLVAVQIGFLAAYTGYYEARVHDIFWQDGPEGPCAPRAWGCWCNGSFRRPPWVTFADE